MNIFALMYYFLIPYHVIFSMIYQIKLTFIFHFRVIKIFKTLLF